MRIQFNIATTALFLGALGLVACGEEDRPAEEMTVGGTTSGGATNLTGADDDSTTTTAEPEMKLDVGGTTGANLPDCDGDGDCELIDVLFVIDNSGTMGEEQLNLARNFPRLIERLQNLEDANGNPVNANVNIAVTTSDFDHPLCAPFQSEDYTPAKGAPIFSGCNSRIEAFESIDPYNPVSIPEACTEQCPNDVSPGGAPYIHFDADGTNVPFNDVAGALSCVGPQGINGCGFEQPLESMLQALRPDQCWNDPTSEDCQADDNWSWVTNSFLREGATLAIAIITDEADCSVLSPDGYLHFTESNKSFWGTDPNTGLQAPTSAICWSGGVQCTDDDGDGVYEECVSRAESEVLHPVSRYTEFLDYLKETRNTEIVMLGVLGVPPVTAHMEEAPFAPTEGGVQDLVYRDWRDGEYDGTDQGGDILPGDWANGDRAEHKQFEFGIGPGCTSSATKEGSFAGQALPPVRIRDVCEHLNTTDENGEVSIRCCIESICDDDFSPAIDCLTGIISETIVPAG